jgi:hypothetical protein
MGRGRKAGIVLRCVIRRYQLEPVREIRELAIKGD